jgi:galactokinase
LTGAGFGGCAVAVTVAADAERCLAATLPAYAAASGRIGTGFRVRAAAAAAPEA